MRPPVSLLAAVSRPCLASTSYAARPFLPRRPVQPLQSRSASWANQGLTWLRNRLAVRNEANRLKEEAERRRARERAAREGEGSIFDVEAQKVLKEEVDVEGGEGREEVQELEVVQEFGTGKKAVVVKKPKKAVTEHTGKTAMFKISHRKLNKLANQIGGEPIDSAILQMQFSPKRASTRIKSMLVAARNQAVDRGLQRERLLVTEAYVNKGPKLKRYLIMGRGRTGIMHHPSARMCVVLKEGKTRKEKKEEEFRKKLGKVRSAGLYRENVPVRTPSPVYVW